MKLLDLDPRWYAIEAGGAPVGLSFDCPHCRTTRLAVLFHHAGRAAMEDRYILAHSAGGKVPHIWDLHGQDDFATLTLTPSIDASAVGHWHGHIQAGEIK